MGWWKAMYVCVGCNNQDRNQQIATANRPLLLRQTQPPEPNRHGSYIVSTEYSSSYPGESTPDESREARAERRGRGESVEGKSVTLVWELGSLYGGLSPGLLSGPVRTVCVMCGTLRDRKSVV